MTKPANVDAADRREWVVPPQYPALEAAGAVVFAVLTGTITEPGARIIAGLAAVLLAAFAVRDRFAGTRLTADANGLTVVHGYAGRRRLTWHDVEGIKIDKTGRFGLSRSLLEIDAGESLYLFSRRELGADVEDVLRDLAAIRTAADGHRNGHRGGHRNGYPNGVSDVR